MFSTYKLLDQSREELAASDNPIALALLVAYDSILKKKEWKSEKVPDSEQFQLKTAWLRLLLEKGYGTHEVHLPEIISGCKCQFFRNQLFGHP